MSNFSTENLTAVCHEVYGSIMNMEGKMSIEPKSDSEHTSKLKLVEDLSVNENEELCKKLQETIGGDSKFIREFFEFNYLGIYRSEQSFATSLFTHRYIVDQDKISTDKMRRDGVDSLISPKTYRNYIFKDQFFSIEINGKILLFSTDYGRYGEEIKMISSKNTDEEKNQEDWSGFELKLMKEIFNLIKKSAHSPEHGLEIITHIFCSFMIGIEKENPEFSYKKVLKGIDEEIKKGSLK